MCGRFAVYSEVSELCRKLNITCNYEFELSFNIAPTLHIPVICEPTKNNRMLVSMRWGLIPSWVKDLKTFSLLSNARAETVSELPAFRRSILIKRCLILADGFYEWKKLNDKTKQPYYIRLKSQKPFLLAGIWENWKDETKSISSCSIITTEANDLIKPLHHRMPVIVSSDSISEWLDPNINEFEKIKKYLIPYDDAELEVFPVTKKVNKADFNSKVCIEELNFN